MNAMPRSLLDREGARVLVVDDDRQVRNVLSRLLQRNVFVVEVAASGAEALAMLVRMPFALVVSDVRMPGMSGLQLITRMADHEIDVPLLVVSSLDPIDVMRELVAADRVCGVFPKPFLADELVAAVRHAVAHTCN